MLDLDPDEYLFELTRWKKPLNPRWYFSVLENKQKQAAKISSTHDRFPAVDWMDGVINLGTESDRSKVSSSQAKRTNSYRASRDY
ncbi:MAG: hypothetical protein HWQ35_05745 [Nostoc sp. NMS1]|uniref:hypothetical protein n=1 Tax=unclassified Nostoc TaxID=2593658 RepID=UPI0025D5BAC0|nr:MULTISPECIES: hypothetical protein [unclassified Nostoc]MBN3906065.1 hypothetical protein [Nostoc sp. NMS1]MBN3992705.1 hypothetical protein [Nostoc sp. NMS2]